MKGIFSYIGQVCPWAIAIITRFEETKTIRKRFKSYVNQLFTLAGYSADQINLHTEAVMKIETGIANVSFTREDLRDSEEL